MGGVFINYRGEDSGTAAVLIDRELTVCFGSDQVFLDNRSIPAGADFVEELLGRLRTCSVLLVVIGPRWLTLTDGTGQRRIDNPADWVRREVAEALRLGLRVIPVLTDDVKLPAEADLPDDIAGLSRRQYVPLRLRYTPVDLAFLVERIIEADRKLAKVAARRHSARQSVPRPWAWVRPVIKRSDVTQLHAARDYLTDEIRHQWSTELERRELSLGRLLAVRWKRTEDEQVMSDPTLLGSRVGLPDALAEQAKELRLTGRLDQVVEAFRRLTVPRVVVTGQPGSGKTTLAMLLTVGLLTPPHEDEPVPVLLPLSSWQVDTEDLATWIGRKLTEDYPALGNMSTYGPTAAVDLFRRRWVLPILDGLDEMTPRARESALAMLNRLPDTEPFVLTCRSEEYQLAVGAVGVLRATPVVELEPVHVDRALDFLDPPRRWHEIRARVADEGPNGALAAALSTPLMIDFARTLYRTGTHDPAELADLQALPSTAAIESHLLEAFMTAVFQAGPTGPGPDEESAAHRWPATRARPWLAFLARHLRGQHSHDITWWRLPLAAGGARLLSAIAFGLLCGAAFGEGAEILRAQTGWVLFGPIAAVGFGLLFWLLGSTLRGESFLGEPLLGDAFLGEPLLGEAQPRAAGRPRRAVLGTVVAGFWSGLAMGLPAGLIAGVTGEVGSGIVLGAAFGLVYAVFNRRVPDSAEVLRPHLATGLGAGVIGWLAAGLIIGFPYAQAFGYVAGLPTGFAVDSLQAWRYGLAFGSIQQLFLGLTAAAMVGLVGGLTAALVTFCTAHLLPAWTRLHSAPPLPTAAGALAVALVGALAGTVVGAAVVGAVFGQSWLVGGGWVGLGFGFAFGLLHGLTRMPEYGRERVPRPAAATARRGMGGLRWLTFRETVRTNVAVLLRAALVGGLFGGLATGLAYGNDPNSYGPVGGSVGQQVALEVATAVIGALTFGVGVGLMIVIGLVFGHFDWPRHPSRFSLRITGRTGALLLHTLGGLAFGLVAGLVYELAFDTRGTARTIWAGLAFGVVLGLTIWFRVPVDDAPAADPRSTLRDDRNATLVSAVLLGGASGLAVVVADGPPIGVMAGVIVLVTVVASSPWMRFTATRCWLAATGKLPLRLMTFLGQAHRLGLIRQVGPTYQFRHARLQEQLEGPAEQTVPHHQPNHRAAFAGLTIVLVAALAVSTRLTMSSEGWLGPGHLLESATAAPALPAQYKGCAGGPPYSTTDGASFRVQGEVHYPNNPGWWCPIWQGADVGAVQARITVHSGAVAYLLVWTPDRRGYYVVALWANGDYGIDRKTEGVREQREGFSPPDGFSPLISPGLHQPNVVTVVDRGDTVYLYVNGAHVDSVSHRSVRGGIVGLGIGNSTDPVDVAFDDVTIWSHQPLNR